MMRPCREQAVRWRDVVTDMMIAQRSLVLSSPFASGSEDAGGGDGDEEGDDDEGGGGAAAAAAAAAWDSETPRDDDDGAAAASGSEIRVHEGFLTAYEVHTMTYHDIP